MVQWILAIKSVLIVYTIEKDENQKQFKLDLNEIVRGNPKNIRRSIKYNRKY